MTSLEMFVTKNKAQKPVASLVTATRIGFVCGVGLLVIPMNSTDSFVTVSLEPSRSSDAEKQQLVRFLFEVLPGSPPVNYFTQKPAHVTVLTNHPSLKKIDFDLQFVSM